MLFTLLPVVAAVGTTVGAVILEAVLDDNKTMLDRMEENGKKWIEKVRKEQQIEEQKRKEEEERERIRQGREDKLVSYTTYERGYGGRISERKTYKVSYKK
ncbi:MAG: hypothetical protein K2M73_09515 [Lachnospiraceae bacterium]|nr:hypothetical protein [Lachnospiraceae bacterium]